MAFGFDTVIPRSTEKVMDLKSLSEHPLDENEYKFVTLYYVYQDGEIIDIIYDRNMLIEKQYLNNRRIVISKNLKNKILPQEYNNQPIEPSTIDMLNTISPIVYLIGHEMTGLNCMSGVADKHFAARQTQRYDYMNEKSYIFDINYISGFLVSLVSLLKIQNILDSFAYLNTNFAVVNDMFSNCQIDAFDMMIFSIAQLIRKYCYLDDKPSWIARWINLFFDNLLIYHPEYTNKIEAIRYGIVIHKLTEKSY